MISFGVNYAETHHYNERKIIDSKKPRQKEMMRELEQSKMTKAKDMQSKKI